MFSQTVITSDLVGKVPTHIAVSLSLIFQPNMAHHICVTSLLGEANNTQSKDNDSLQK